jgi:serine protease AprX
MKRIILAFLTLLLVNGLFSQNIYWVYFTDKNETTFDPYSYFDAKAIERRVQQNISLFDMTDFPLNNNYKEQVINLSEEFVGETRWFNAVAVAITDENLPLVQELPFVKNVERIETEGKLATYKDHFTDSFEMSSDAGENAGILPQLERFEGDLFVQNQIDGKGIRIAVFDGGFPGVDKHEAFAHLRENNRIIKTWNFPLKKENVYGWHSHGTMVLSCIAGIQNGKKMGLATGAEFLLARTEINTEPAKEEVWWMQAVEWADKNGANVINSSLGYGKSRYYVEDMDGKQSLVSKAANMAAAKGMLVCNAMGNEGSDKAWRTLITPADADSVISVGGLNPATDKRIYFSSFGPTADGRLKPNVVAFGTADVAKPRGGYTNAPGTSFSSPLVAGFVACAWQTRPQLKAMELKAEIEKSADLYPYFDYQYGYGVPQAGYFINPTAQPIETSRIAFTESENAIFVSVTPDENDKNNTTLLLHVQKPDGQLRQYWEVEFSDLSSMVYPLNKSKIENGDILRVYYQKEVKELRYGTDFIPKDKTNKSETYNYYVKDVPQKNEKPSAYGVLSKYFIYPYISWGFITPPFNGSDYQMKYGNSQTFMFGLRFKGNVCKWYNLGFSAEIGYNKFHVKNFEGSQLFHTEYLRTSLLNLEFYQRFRLVPDEGLGVYFDTGIYGSWVYGNQHFMKKKLDPKIIKTETRGNIQGFNPLQWGVRARFGYNFIALYGQYRFSDLFNEKMGKTELPRLEAGVELAIPL